MAPSCLTARDPLDDSTLSVSVCRLVYKQDLEVVVPSDS